MHHPIRRRRRIAATVAGVFALAMTGATVAGALAPSTFESADGNTAVDTAGNQDWDHLTTATLETDTDDSLTGPTDESFTQGTKSDTPVPTVEFGSIPPNKSDLTNMKVASETIDGDVFLYVYWERSNTLGSANMNFEFNRTSEKSANGYTPIRSVDDVLITFDFAQGGATVNLGLAQWAQDTCEANGGKLPDCWSDLVDLDASGFADGAVSADLTFGEAAINLTDAGVFQTGTCTTLGSAYLTSRSSDSFTAALKDFVPPADISITNCGSVEITKTDDADNPLAGAEFTLYHNNAPLDPPLGAEDTITDPVQSCTTAADGTCTILDVFFGDYIVHETVVPAGHNAAPDQAISVVDTTAVELTFVNPRQRGAIEITKTAKHFDTSGETSANLVANFSVKLDGVEVATATTDATGKACVSGLLYDTYTVEETSGPGGYLLDDSVENVTVDTESAGCGLTDSPATVSFENQPLSDIAVTFNPQVVGGTAASITCTGLTPDGGDTTPTAFDDTTETYSDLVEGTYTCTIVVDP